MISLTLASAVLATLYSLCILSRSAESAATSAEERAEPIRSVWAYLVMVIRQGQGQGEG